MYRFATTNHTYFILLGGFAKKYESALFVKLNSIFEPGPNQINLIFRSRSRSSAPPRRSSMGLELQWTFSICREASSLMLEIEPHCTSHGKGGGI